MTALSLDLDSDILINNEIRNSVITKFISLSLYNYGQYPSLLKLDEDAEDTNQIEVAGGTKKDSADKLNNSLLNVKKIVKELKDHRHIKHFLILFDGASPRTAKEGIMLNFKNIVDYSTSLSDTNLVTRSFCAELINSDILGQWKPHASRWHFLVWSSRTDPPGSWFIPQHGFKPRATVHKVTLSSNISEMSLSMDSIMESDLSGFEPLSPKLPKTPLRSQTSQSATNVSFGPDNDPDCDGIWYTAPLLLTGFSL